MRKRRGTASYRPPIITERAPQKTNQSINPILAHRLQRWGNIDPTLRQCQYIVFGRRPV